VSLAPYQLILKTLRGRAAIGHNFSHRRRDSFTTAELQAGVAEALDIPIKECPLSPVRYELSNCSIKSMRAWPQASFTRTVEIESWRTNR
jgi:hypothetical protein